MLHAIYGTSKDSIGYLLAGHFTTNTGYPISEPFSAMGWMKDKDLVGQCIFNDYTGANIEIHLYAPKCFNKKTIRDVYTYVFNQLGCERLTAKPYTTNKKLLQLLERIGFVYEFTQEGYYKENNILIDAEVYKLTRKTIPSWVKLNA